jgi:hypothetical protein
MSTNDMPYRKAESSDNKIPLWVRIFFWCSLLLFCVSFYKAIIYPQLDGGQVDEGSIEFLMDWDEDKNMGDNSQNINDYVPSDSNETNITQESWLKVPETATETIEEYFSRLSNRDFDWAFDLMIPVLRSASEIREHFTSFRMNPFLDWIEWWKLTPTNFQYVKSPTYWKDVYNFDLSYTMNSDQSKYDEIWEFTVNTQWDFPKISSIRCITPKCSYHPIFWPENFGLME